MKRICTINARSGSKGVPGKNLATIRGRSLIEYSLEQAFDSGVFDSVAVSSDSQEILDVAIAFSAMTILRPTELATDVAPKVSSIVHCVKEAERRLGSAFNTVVDLDATSPLRNLDDIRASVDLLESNSHDSVFSATPARRSPYFNQVSRDSRGNWGPVIRSANGIVRRQDAPETFDMNASIYVWNRDSLMSNPSVFQSSTGIYIMPEERSWDIDSPFDLEVVRWLLEARIS